MAKLLVPVTATITLPFIFSAMSVLFCCAFIYGAAIDEYD